MTVRTVGADHETPVLARAGRGKFRKHSPVRNASLPDDASERPNGSFTAIRIALTVAALTFDLVVWGGQTHSWTGGDLPLLLVLVPIIAVYVVIAIVPSPVPGIIAMVALATTGLGMDTFAGLGGLLVSIFLSSYRLRRRGAGFALLASIPPIVNHALVVARYMDEEGPSYVLTTSALWCISILIAWGVGRFLARTERRLAAERRWAVQARDEALAAERLRISRDLHDSVAHSLTGIVLQTAGLQAGLRRSTLSREQLDQALANIQDASEQSVREMHRLVGLLREDQAHDGGVDGIEEIPRLVESSRASGYDVVTRTVGEPVPIDPSIARAAYRVVQEGLSNAMRHGRPGARADVTVEWTPQSLVVSVRNGAGLEVDVTEEGDGISLPRGGFGLIGLRERIAVLGGTLEAGPQGDSYLLRATMPLDGAPAPAVIPPKKEQK